MSPTFSQLNLTLVLSHCTISKLPTIVASIVHLDGAEVDAEAAVVADAPADRVRGARRPVEAAATAGGTIASSSATVIPVTLERK